MVAAVGCQDDILLQGELCTPPRTDPQGLKSRPPERLFNHIPCALSTVADNETVHQVVLFRN